MRPRISSCSIVCLISLLLAAGTSSCCLNCPNPPKEGQLAYSASDFDPPNQPSGEVIDGIRVIKMTAKKYQFSPSVIRINHGDKVRLEITSKDVTHGFGLSTYKIDRKLEPAKTEIIEFTADKAGTFEFHCTVFCCMGHLGMKGKLIVEPK